ncbi:hypothetical protein A3L12_03295 [Thermococcus sp. P6]|uniref:DUF1102 domain-containing protein n=1 Tax=Thermococcus sp. P6 TaxID=122420 RepID=UPI000B5986F7|nr:DUF1102 domain-containing protein [Thermococcus sp. P6]ASJ10393.1 hypothetical protein A3L12_03295 [Thermococcus sp. P6]
MVRNATLIIGFGILLIILTGIRGLSSPDTLNVVYVYGLNGTFSPDHPSPPYVRSNNEGSLSIDVSPDGPFYPSNGSGLGVNATFVFEDVFTIRNNLSQTGYEEVCIDIASNSPKVGLFTGRFEGNWSDALEVTLGENESLTVGMMIDTHDTPPGDYREWITIGASGGGCG